MQWRRLFNMFLIFIYIGFWWQTKGRLAQNTSTFTSTAFREWSVVTDQLSYNIILINNRFIRTWQRVHWEFRWFLQEFVTLSFIYCAKNLLIDWIKKNKFYTFRNGFWFSICILVTLLTKCARCAIHSNNAITFRFAKCLWPLIFSKLVSKQNNCRQSEMMRRQLNTLIFLELLEKLLSVISRRMA